MATFTTAPAPPPPGSLEGAHAMGFATRRTALLPGLRTSVAYPVVTPVFEGPIDLLLHLIQSHRVDILDIPLAPIVDGFLAELTAMAGGAKEMGVDRLSQFLLVAAVLVELKSVRLLPGPDGIEDDEEMVGWEARDLLLARLLECRAYAAAADVFVEFTERAAQSLPREAGLEPGFAIHAPDLLAGVTPDRLAQAYCRATAERPAPRVDVSHVTVDSVTVSETVRALLGRLSRAGTTSFRSLTEGLVTRIEVIVHFLAILELCKVGRVSIGQGHTFGDLEVTWISTDAAVGGDRAHAAYLGAAASDSDDLDFEVDDYEG